jgi:hypothetical protein
MARPASPRRDWVNQYRDVHSASVARAAARLGDGPERDREHGAVREMRRVAEDRRRTAPHGQEPALEVVQEMAGLLGRLMPRTDQADPKGFEARDERLDEEPVLLLDEVVDAGGDGQHGLARSEPVGSDRAVARGDLALEPGHPDHVVLVRFKLRCRGTRARGGTVSSWASSGPAIELEPGRSRLTSGALSVVKGGAVRLAEEQAVAGRAWRRPS